MLVVILVSIYLFILGLCFGSFALAVADRTRAKKNWVTERSACDSCGHVLGVLDLIPVLSWVCSGGRCRHCRTRLPARYPLVEVVMGLLFTGSYLVVHQDINFVSGLQLSLWLIGLVLMMILLIIDARSFLLPYKFLFPLILVSALHACIELLASESIGQQLLILLSALAVGFGVFLVLFLVSSGSWIGDGDVLFGLVIGFYLMQPFEAWLTIVVASITGLFYGLYFVLREKKPLRKAKIPFGPFLIAGLIVAYLFGGQIIDWYVSTFLFW